MLKIYLEYYALTPLSEQQDKLENIISDLEGYRRVLDILTKNEDTLKIREEHEKYNAHVDSFGPFFKD